MRHEERALADITDRTMTRLINEAVVLPARYLETFSEEEKGSLLQEQEGNRTGYTAADGEALRHDEPYEIGLLRHQLFSDDITEAKNRLWVYKQKLNERQGFGDFGFVLSIKVAGYGEIVKEYDLNVGSKLLKMVSDYMIGYLKENHIAFEIARFSKEHFLVFVHDMDESAIEELVANMQKGMGNYTFKHRNRIFGLSIDAVAIQYVKNEPFASVMDQLEEKRLLSGN